MRKKAKGQSQENSQIVEQTAEQTSVDQMGKELMAAWMEGLDADKSANFGFLTEAFSGRLNGINDEIKILIKQGDGFEKQIAVKMDAMLSLFMAETSGVVKDPKEAKKTALEDFYKYSEAEFGFKKTRAMDYQSVGCREDVMALDLPFSQLVEIARIDGDALQTLLQMFPESELKKYSYRETKELARVFNEKKRTSKKGLKLVKGGKSEPTPTIEESVDEASTQVDATESAQEVAPANVVSMPLNSIDAIEKLIRQFEAIKDSFKVDEIPAKYAQDLQSMAKWCLAASATHMDKRERA